MPFILKISKRDNTSDFDKSFGLVTTLFGKNRKKMGYVFS